MSKKEWFKSQMLDEYYRLQIERDCIRKNRNPSIELISRLDKIEYRLSVLKAIFDDD